MNINVFLFSSFLFSFCSTFYQFFLARLIGEFLADFPLSVSITSGVYALGAGLGLMRANKISKKNWLTLLLYAEASAIALMSLSTILFFNLHMSYRILFKDWLFEGLQDLYILCSFCELYVFFLGLLSGLQIYSMLQNAQKNSIYGPFYAVYCFACLCSAIFVCLCTILEISLHSQLISVLCCNTIILILFIRLNSLFPYKFYALCFSAILLCRFLGPIIENIYVKGFYYNKFSWSIDASGVKIDGPCSLKDWYSVSKKYPDVDRSMSRYQLIEILLDENKQAMLYLDRHLQVSIHDIAEYHSGFLEIVNKHASNSCLIVGGGDGILAAFIRRQGLCPHLVLVELDAKIYELAKIEPLLKLNDGIFYRNDIDVILQDVNLWLRRSKDKFDLVYVDIPLPFSLEHQALLSREFFLRLNKRIKYDGFFIEDIPLAYLEDKYWQILKSTVTGSGFFDIKTHNKGGHFFLSAKKRTSNIFPVGSSILFGHLPVVKDFRL